MRVRHTRRSQRGFTLVELLLGIVLSGIFGLALLAFFSSSRNQATTHENQAMSQSQARSALERITSELRQAISPDGGFTPPVISLSPTAIEFYYDGRRAASDLTIKPQRVRYRIVGTDLLRDAQTPVGAAPPYSYSTYGPTVTVVSGIANGANPMFAGKDANGAPMAASFAAPTTANLAQITLRLIVGYRTGYSNATLELTTDVVPRNPRTNN